MQFKNTEWKKYYESVQKMGKMLKNSQPYMDDKGGWSFPIAPLSKKAQRNLEKEIIKVLKKCTIYLDICGIKCNQPLWQYNIKDQTTWVSDKSFQYEHLLAAKGVINE